MLAKLAGVLRDFGPVAGTLYLLDRVLRRLHPRCGLHVYELMLQAVDAKPLLPERIARHITFRVVAEDDPAVQRMPARPEIKRARFASGARCLGVERRGELLGYIWLSFGDYHEDEVRCTYCLPRDTSGRPEGAFDFDLYVFPEHRMGLGFVAIWHAACAYLHGQGVRGSYSRMTRFNLASRRAHLRLGSKITGRAWFLSVGALELMAATRPPYAALTWGTQRVRLRMAAMPGPVALPAPPAR